MTNADVYDRAARAFRERYGRVHTVAAYAPGRVEVLGNHTDYNEGFVLSAAINFGTFFLAAPADGPACRLTAADIDKTVAIDLADLKPDPAAPWANYVIGIAAGLADRANFARGFDALFLGNVPLGAGLSSSAALEISTGLALAALAGIRVGNLDLARIGQRAEHDFAGVQCGLLDQMSSLYGRAAHLVMTDFRTLATATVPIGAHACFLMCNTAVKHALVDGEYNRRRAACERAAAHFATVLDHPVAALRDVTWTEWERHRTGLDDVAARRAAHPIGENDRVTRGRTLLETADLETFGELMFASHRSSRDYFENSCRELDFLVDAARRIPGVLGARLSGGGFGGSAVVLLHPRDAEVAARALATAYRREFGHPCETSILIPSEGAALLAPTPP